MEMPNLVPAINIADLQAKVNEYAQKGAEQCVKDYYTGRDSPYKKAIEKALTVEGDLGIKLPNIIALINEGLASQYDELANSGVAQTFLPLITQSLLGIDKEMKLSQFLIKVIEESSAEEQTDYSFKMEKSNRFECFDCFLKIESEEYEFQLYPKHTYLDDKFERNFDKCHLSFLPHITNWDYTSRLEMTLQKGDVSLKMPFTPNILQNPIMMLFANLIICKTEITIDCEGFEYEFFTEFDDRFENGRD